jgi:hypothetical protein
MSIYVVILDYWSEGSHVHDFEDILVGVFTDKNKACRVGLKAEVKRNLEYRYGKNYEVIVDALTDDDRESGAKVYKAKAKELDTIDIFNDSFMKSWSMDREDYYLNFGDGYRFKIGETKIDKELIKEFKEFVSVDHQNL